MKKHILLISVGVLNVLHGSFHIFQFIQSMFFVVYATQEHNHDESLIQTIMHNPIFALIMGIIGIVTLVIGIKDYKHHNQCSSETKLTVREQKLIDLLNDVKEKTKISTNNRYVIEHIDKKLKTIVYDVDIDLETDFNDTVSKAKRLGKELNVKRKQNDNLIFYNWQDDNT